jgi:hypothetical protein
MKGSKLGVFAQLTTIALDAYDRIVGLVLEEISVDGCVTKAPGGGECAGPSPVDRRKQGMKRSLMVEGYGMPLGRVLAGANRHDSPLLAPTLDRLDELGPLPEDITVHPDSGYDSGKTRDTLAERGLRGQIAHNGEKAPIQAGRRRHVERTNSWHNGFNRLQRCYERSEIVIDARLRSRAGRDRFSSSSGTPGVRIDWTVVRVSGKHRAKTCPWICP